MQGIMRRSYSHSHSSDTNKAFKYLTQVKAFTEEVGIDFAEFTSLLQEISRNPTRLDDPNFIKRVSNTFGDRQDLILGLNTFLPERYQISINELQIPNKNRALESAIDLVNMVRPCFQDDEFAYKGFLNAVTENRFDKAASFLVGYQDLLQKFVRLVSCNNSEVMKNPKGKKRTGVQDSEDWMKRVYRKGIDLFERVKANILQDDADEYLKFLKHVHCYNRNRIALGDVAKFFARNSQVKAKFEELLDQCENIGNNKRPKLEKKNCTPSYCYMPTYNTSSHHKSAELNYEWISRCPVEGEKFKNRPTTLKEEIMNRCEDDRYELDMLLNRLRSCVLIMEKILKLITKTSENDKIINVQEHLSIIQLKCIGKLYDEWGDDAIEALTNNPAIAVPVILNSLKMKVKECEEFRIAFNSMILATNSSRKLFGLESG